MNEKIKLNKTSDTVLKIILEKSEEGKNMVKLRELLLHFQSTKNESIKELLYLFEKDKLTITNQRRDKYEPYLSYNEEGYFDHKNEDTCIKKLIELFNFYNLLQDEPSLEDFNLLTENKYKHHLLFSFLEQYGINYTETKIYFNAIKGFISGLHPVYLNDMNLSAFDLAFYSEQFLNKSSNLIQNELIKIHTESDGVTCKVGITKHTLSLIQGTTNTASTKSNKKQHGLYVYKPLESLELTKLYYNSSEQFLFERIINVLKKHDDFSDKNITILLHGPSGTGKTEFAYQLAKQLNSDIMQFDFSQIQSKWVGETEKNIKSIFTEYHEQSRQRIKPLILLMNEADGLMNRRVSVNTSNDIHSNLAQAQLLEMFEEFKGILIATTNMYQNIDVAFHRRFLFKHKIDLPNNSTKEALLKDSFICGIINESIVKNVLNSRWSVAQLRNLERKIVQFELLNELNENLILEMLNEEGMLNSSKLGY